MATSINYVLIDFESVRPSTLADLDTERFKLFVFLGENQTKLSFPLVDAVQPFGARAKYVQISGNGPNALDFHIAFYMGQLAAADPTASFYIVSKDKGFDPLIRHLTSRKIYAARVEAITGIQELMLVSEAAADERLQDIVDRLRRFNSAKPRTLRTLSSTISSHFKKALSISEVDDLIQGLLKRGWLAIEGSKVTYALPD